MGARYNERYTVNMDYGGLSIFPRIRFARVESILLIENKIIDKDELKASCSYGKPIRARLSHDFPAPVQKFHFLPICARLSHTLSGVPDRLRPLLWRLLLEYLPTERASWVGYGRIHKIGITNWLSNRPDGRRSWPRNEIRTTGWCDSWSSTLPRSPPRQAMYEMTRFFEFHDPCASFTRTHRSCAKIPFFCKIHEPCAIVAAAVRLLLALGRILRR